MEHYNLLEIDARGARILYSVPIRNVLRLVRIPRGAYLVKVRGNGRALIVNL